MRVVSVYDLSGSESMRALRHLRRQNLRAVQGTEDVQVESDEILRQVYERLGGRTSYLAKVARADDMLGEGLQRCDGARLTEQRRRRI
jgi:hypothetical protein